MPLKCFSWDTSNNLQAIFAMIRRDIVLSTAFGIYVLERATLIIGTFVHFHHYKAAGM
jgi:hypothetical protein